MNRNLTVAMAAALVMSGGAQAQDVNIGRSSITLKSDLMTPEALWAMGHRHHLTADGSSTRWGTTA